MSQYIAVFQRQSIDGKKLLALDRPAMRDMKIRQIDCVKIGRALEKLKSEMSTAGSGHSRTCSFGDALDWEESWKGGLKSPTNTTDMALVDSDKSFPPLLPDNVMRKLPGLPSNIKRPGNPPDGDKKETGLTRSESA